MNISHDLRYRQNIENNSMWIVELHLKHTYRNRFPLCSFWLIKLVLVVLLEVWIIE